MNNSIVRDVEINNKIIKFEFNKFAKQANGSVLVQCGNMVLLATAVMSKKPKEGIDFLSIWVILLNDFLNG